MIRRFWTEREKSVLSELYPTLMPASEIAALLGFSLSSVYNQAKLLGLRKPPECQREAGKKGAKHPKSIATRFVKGCVPANKGKKMSESRYARCALTMFRKGNIPANHRPVGSERVNIYGYIEIKTAEPNKWRLKHRVVWEEANGLVPAGHNIQFLNGDRRDVRIENLYIIDRPTQMAEKNSIHARYPESIKSAIRAKATLKRQITFYNKKNKNYEQ